MAETLKFQESVLTLCGEMPQVASLVPGRMSTDNFLALNQKSQTMFAKGDQVPHIISCADIPNILNQLAKAKVDLKRVGNLDVNRGAVVKVEPYRSFWRRKPSETRSTITFDSGDTISVEAPRAEAVKLLLG